MVFAVKEDSATVAANSTKSLTYEVREGRTFRIRKIAFNSTGSFKINEIKDSATGHNYIYGSLYSDQMKEFNGNVLHLDDPIELRGSTKLVVEVEDTSGASNTVSIAMIGSEE